MSATREDPYRAARTTKTPPASRVSPQPRPVETAVAMEGNGRPTRLNVRDLAAEVVWTAMREHADEISDVRDVLKLHALRDVAGERIAVAVADLVADGRCVGATGRGRIRAVETSA